MRDLSKGVAAIITLMISGAFLVLPFIVIDWPSIFVAIIVAILIFVLGDFWGNLVLTGTFIWGFIEIVNKPVTFLSVLYYIVFAVFIIYYVIKIIVFILELKDDIQAKTNKKSRDISFMSYEDQMTFKALDDLIFQEKQSLKQIAMNNQDADINETLDAIEDYTNRQKELLLKYGIEIQE